MALGDWKNEVTVMDQVASEYGLSPAQTKLLMAIRKAENGRVGREFGVLNSQAMRFTDPIKSFRTQAKWAAGTIRKRYTGDLEAFAKRWAPIGASNDPSNLNANWLDNVKNFLASEPAG